MRLASAEAVDTRTERGNGSRVLLRPTVNDVLAAQRLLYDRVFGKPAQSLSVEIDSPSEPAAGAHKEILTTEDREKLAAVWHAALVRAARGPVVEVQAKRPVQHLQGAEVLKPTL